MPDPTPAPAVTPPTPTPPAANATQPQNPTPPAPTTPPTNAPPGQPVHAPVETPPYPKPQEPPNQPPDTTHPPPKQTGSPPVPPTAAAVEPQKPMTIQEYLNAAPLEVREALQSGMRMHEAHKSGLINKLTALSARCKFTSDQLKAMDVTMLENLVDLAAVPDYGGVASGDSMRAHSTPSQDEGDSAWAPAPPRLEVVPSTPSNPPKAAA
jgi:hypothetical protein